MKDLVGYHNAEKMGYSFQDAGDPMVFRTRKAVNHLVGARLWVISGEGWPRSYFLAGWFIVDRVGPCPEDPSERWVRGTVGQMFKPMIRLNKLSWFPRFRASQSNFSLGLQHIDDEFVPNFEAVAAEAAFARSPSPP
ncbi:MAG: hypothetical protein ACOY71_02595 [Gemmatimonadota bacterium]